MHDRAPQVNVSDDRLSVTGHKFYCLIRANHFVNNGSWFFEVKIQDLPEGAATRIGWAQKNANLQVNLCQKLLFLHQLTHNMTKDCSLIYKFNTQQFQAQNMGRTCCVQKLILTFRTIYVHTCSPHVLPK